MKTSVLLGLLALLGVAVAKPTFLEVPTLAYATLVPGAPVGPDGRVVDTPEVSVAKNQHAAAQLNERVNLAKEAERSGEVEVSLAAPQTVGQLLVTQPGGLARILTGQELGVALQGPLTLTSLVQAAPSAAPVGPDGRVVDTPAVAQAKAEHAAAHLNEKLQLVNEATRNSGLIAISTSPAIALRL